MAGLKIKNETVYVIYRNGQPYQVQGRKLVYTSKGAANGVITTDVNDEARYNTKNFYDLPSDQRVEIVEGIRKEFTVVEYGPKGGAK